MPIEMRHLVIFLPGIMGSVLQKDGKDIWALSGQAVGQYLRTKGKSLQELSIDDDWQAEDLGDGITATGLIPDIYSIPGICEHAGYSIIIQRLKEHFDVTKGSIHEPGEDANFFTFFYDWRRDNRASARKLQSFIEYQLPRWRASQGAVNAQVILIGHSMGGLVSRYYLEALGGWRDCLALITVGTPHRGALGALDVLSNGFHRGEKEFFHRLTAVARSFTSLYQILPTYPVIDLDDTYVRVSETDAIPNIHLEKAKAAREEFHEVIRRSALRNRSDPVYVQRTLPWIGTRQATPQSARLSKGKLVISHAAPQGLDESLADGDGTVPRVSAVPPDLDGLRYERFAVERHGWLTNNDMALQPILDELTKIAAKDSRNLYGETKSTHSSINLQLEPLYLFDEPVTVRVKLDSDKSSQSIKIKIVAIEKPGVGAKRDIQVNTNEAQSIEFHRLVPGLYQLSVGPQVSVPNESTTVHGVFEVVDPDSLE